MMNDKLPYEYQVYIKTNELFDECMNNQSKGYKPTTHDCEILN